VPLLSPCPDSAGHRGRMAAHPPRKAFTARAIGENGFAGPGGVRGPPRATATAKIAYTWWPGRPWPRPWSTLRELFVCMEHHQQQPKRLKQAAPASISKRSAFSMAFRKWKICTRLINHLIFSRNSNEMPTAKEPIEGTS
jgi:hypothetical protein